MLFCIQNLSYQPTCHPQTIFETTPSLVALLESIIYPKNRSKLTQQQNRLSVSLLRKMQFLLLKIFQANTNKLFQSPKKVQILFLNTLQMYFMIPVCIGSCRLNQNQLPLANNINLVMINPERLFSENEGVYTSDQSEQNMGLRQLNIKTQKLKPEEHRIDVRVSSQIGMLNKVLIHRPNLGHARISPKDAQQLLFDDIVHLPQMQKQHDIFTSILRAFVGRQNVIEVKDLLVEVLNIKLSVRKELIEKVAITDKLTKETCEKLETLNNEQLIETLITGYSSNHDEDIIGPIPNFIFTRDIAVTVNNHLLITKPAKSARMRQEILTGTIFKYHPYFVQLAQKNLIIDLSNDAEFPASSTGEIISVEGGDVMMIHQDYLLIGHGQRTTQYAFEQISKRLLERKIVKNVVQVNIPADRSCMHIDTLFTQISNNHVVAYKPIVVDGLNSNVIVHRQSGQIVKYDSIAKFFLGQLNPKMEFILSGNGKSPFQQRQQWTDGCNLVALRSGVALTYDRNIETAKALEKAGYTIIEAEKLLKNIKLGKITVQSIENTIVTLPSNQLSRGRGGSHCMTCPLNRK